MRLALCCFRIPFDGNRRGMSSNYSMCRIFSQILSATSTL
ncbi:unnamed protein product [Strongylus vulgaris]|uniref:Uncharacterized protein n=1 Tax=Strongylus vulgaris TaxID=40348 RepID=A0A3P7J2D3_STRVU|nr:unnamed protein product [Strongylus vulgaris]